MSQLVKLKCDIHDTCIIPWSINIMLNYSYLFKEKLSKFISLLVYFEVSHMVVIEVYEFYIKCHT